MDLSPEEFQFLRVPDILKESISIPKKFPKTFSLVTLTLIFPLSLVILAQSLFADTILSRLYQLIELPTRTGSQAMLYKLLVLQFCYIIFLFTFSLLSTAAVTFTVASLYTSKPISSSSTLAAIPSVFRRLFITFIWVSLFMIVYNTVSLGFLLLLAIVENVALSMFAIIVVLLLFPFVHAYVNAFWHLASVVSVLEPVYGFAAMKKSYALLKGRTLMSFVLVLSYLAFCGVLNLVFGWIVVHGGESHGVLTRIIVGGLVVGGMVILNLVGLLVQSVFYYVCKSYHHQGIDKCALYDHLGGYLGEYVPLKSSIQMENLEA
ncbi:hypothetical protein Fot_45818 [Forsythia ovata]|uniref:Uncharacterized protein n=1 Tax=Forsythia ovata TaxID=205694 RepID=A0ABD1RAZ0_9LAMI